MNIVVLGGGITGLSSAFHLSRRFPDARITLIEKANRLGGWIKSERVDAASSSVVLGTGPRTLRPVDKATLELVSSPLLHKNIAHPSLVDPPLGPHPTTHHNSQNLVTWTARLLALHLALSLRMPTSVDLLPEDVLREIFIYSVPPESRLFSWDSWSRFGPRGILNLTHVCSRWRQIVLSMPHLWSTIRVSEHHTSLDEVQFMHEWLSRAAAVPKTLFIGLQQGSSGDGMDPFRTIFVLYPFQKLSIFIDFYDFEAEGETLIALPNQLWEHLEELNIDELRVMFRADAKLPNLQSLSLSEVGDFRRYTAIPWSQIRRLTLSGVSASTHLLSSVLKQCLCLEYCKIERPNCRHTLAPFYYITLPNLQSFELSEFGPESHNFGAECMQRLIIPSVNILKLSSCNVDTSVYSRFIEQSGGMPRLHTLTLCEPADAGMLLKLLPHLESITVSRDLGSGIWQDLSTGKLGPCLKH
jgi:hypothetical protein